MTQQVAFHHIYILFIVSVIQNNGQIHRLTSVGRDFYHIRSLILADWSQEPSLLVISPTCLWTRQDTLWRLNVWSHWQVQTLA